MHNHIYEDLSMLHPKWRALLMSSLWYMSFFRISNFIVSSDSMLKYYKTRVLGNKNFFKIPYGVAKPCVNAITIDLPSVIEKYKVIGSCGVLIKRKGYDQLIRYISTNEDTALVLIGDGPDRVRLESLASSLNISERVFILGFKDNYADYYRYFDVFAMTSYSEGYGIAMLEALSLGIPLICSDLDIYRDVFPSYNVCQFEPGNLDSLYSAIDSCFSSLKENGNKSKEIYKDNFSLDNMGRAHMEFYRDICALD
jgi:glycosyltransferase involved in cell wall biosynthesis